MRCNRTRITTQPLKYHFSWLLVSGKEMCVGGGGDRSGCISKVRRTYHLLQNRGPGEGSKRKGCPPEKS